MSIPFLGKKKGKMYTGNFHGNQVFLPFMEILFLTTLLRSCEVNTNLFHFYCIIKELKGKKKKKERKEKK